MGLEAYQDTKVLVFQIATGSVALYNTLELLALIFYRFKRYSTLYFWSITIATLGTALFTAGFFPLFTKDLLVPALVILTVGWWSMVTGFSVIMYSRLHIMNCDPRLMLFCRWMIIFNFVFMHLPTTFLTFAANLSDPKTPEGLKWTNSYAIMEKVQMTSFWLQETFLSVVYLYYTRRMSSGMSTILQSKKKKEVVFHTMYINVLVLLLDLAAVIVEYLNLYDYQIMFKALLYSLKIKLEFAILNILTDAISRSRNGTTSSSQHGMGEKGVGFRPPANAAGGAGGGVKTFSFAGGDIALTSLGGTTRRGGVDPLSDDDDTITTPRYPPPTSTPPPPVRTTSPTPRSSSNGNGRTTPSDAWPRYVNPSVSSSTFTPAGPGYTLFKSPPPGASLSSGGDAAAGASPWETRPTNKGQLYSIEEGLGRRDGPGGGAGAGTWR
ncbi:hypothetical protein HK104_009182 [Borealophlyctis nickersoniae]|nr:hypothetical protein HK104_009182 [Borealophlyctis nickersoniae]